MARSVAVVFYLACVNIVSTLVFSTGGDIPYPGPDYYCITPRCDSLCPPKCKSRCNDLEFYVSRANHYFKSNTTFLFISGTHQHVTNFIVRSVANLTFKTITSEDSATVQCSQDYRVGFVFRGCSRIIIQSITFCNCGQQFNTPHNQTFLAALAFLGGSYLTLDRVIINESTAYGLHVNGVQNYIAITSCKFIGAGYGHNQTNRDSYIAGNSIFAECNNFILNKGALNIIIENSEFLSNKNRPNCADVDKNDDDKYCKCHHLASGLSIILRRSNVLVNLTNLILMSNSGCRGGNLAIVFNTSHPFSGHVILTNSLIQNGIATYGGGLYIFYLSAPNYDNNNYYCNPENTSVSDLVTIVNTTFENNTAFSGGGLHIRLTESLAICIPVQISITDDCLFQHNTLSYAGYGGAAIHSVNFLSFEYKRQTLPQFLLGIKQSRFKNHPYSKLSKWKNSGSGVIYVKTNHRVEIENVSIYGNQYSGIMIVDSNLVVSGSVDIYNNSGSSGGGMLFCSNSVMFLTPYTTVTIANNEVEHAGGGICVEDQCLQSKPACFFQLDYEASIRPELNSTIKILLINNSANYAGDQIYGGSIDFCYIVDSPFHNVSLHEGDSVEAYNQLFSILPNVSYSVTSPQRHVCLCYSINNETMERNCSDSHFTQQSVYPGESFSLPAVVVGQLDGIVPGTVYAELKPTLKDDKIVVVQSLLQDQAVQKTSGKECVKLNYTIRTNYHCATLVLSVQFVGDKSFAEHLKSFKPLEIGIEIKKCPLGYSNGNNFCSCLPPLQVGFDCNINHETIIPHPGYWIGYSQDFFSETTILYSTGCTIDYCKNTHPDYDENKQCCSIRSEPTKFSNQDDQCKFYRTGILCGACPMNSSVILGSSQCCDDCGNMTLLLIPLFAVMGVLLVVLLMVLNMTVTEGTINGLLFYANIVQISNVVFFRGMDIPFLSPLLKGFIAWLNLDFGVSTCLYNGMDDYAKAWLQFAFPLYIWLITGIIIYLSRHFTFVTRLANKNGVKVLATLILLSYAKMVRASIVAIHFKILHHMDSNGSTDNITLCWYSDCNIQYMKGKHIPLGIAGFISLFCLMPFALLLLFTDVLSRIKFFSCMWKLKPFLDTYTGPYTNEGRYWTGLLLVMRFALFVASSFNHSTGTTSLNVTLANMMIAFLLILPWLLQSGVYCKQWLNTLECLFLFNLIILTTGTQYLLFYSKHKLQRWLTHISIGLAFTTFILIMLYHVCQFENVKLAKSKLMNKCCQRKTHVRDNFDGLGSQTSDSDDDLLAQFPSVIRFDQDREPLLKEI